MLEDSVKKMLDNAFQSTSANVVRMTNYVRSEVIDEQQGLNDDVDVNASIIRNALTKKKQI